MSQILKQKSLKLLLNPKNFQRKNQKKIPHQKTIDLESLDKMK